METASKPNKRALILEAAYQLFLEKGYANTKIIDIANRAGIGKGTVYEYFDSKTTLFGQLCETKFSNHFDELDAIRHMKLSSSEKLFEFLRREYKSFDSVRDGNKFFPSLVVAADLLDNERIRSVLTGMVAAKFELIRDVIQEGIDSGEFAPVDASMAASVFMGALHFFLSFKHDIFPPHSPCFPDFREQPEEAIHLEQFQSLFMNGLANPN